MSPERSVTPTKITAWLDCAHFLTLTHQVEDGTREAPAGGMGAFARLLADKGLKHEEACLAEYEGQGKRVLHVPSRHPRESFQAWVVRVGSAFDGEWDVLYQMPLAHDGIRGIADFLVRTVADNDRVSWEPVDAKLARAQAKPGHVLQLCFYAEAIEAVTGTRPAEMHLWLGSGAVETLAVHDFSAYWRRLRQQLATVLDDPADQVVTTPVPCAHCGFCTFADVCDAQWRAEDSLLYVAGLRAPDWETLLAADVATLAVPAPPAPPGHPSRAAAAGPRAGGHPPAVPARRTRGRPHVGARLRPAARTRRRRRLPRLRGPPVLAGRHGAVLPARPHRAR